MNDGKRPDLQASMLRVQGGPTGCSEKTVCHFRYLATPSSSAQKNDQPIVLDTDNGCILYVQ